MAEASEQSDAENSSNQNPSTAASAVELTSLSNGGDSRTHGSNHDEIVPTNATKSQILSKLGSSNPTSASDTKSLPNVVSNITSTANDSSVASTSSQNQAAKNRRKSVPRSKREHGDTMNKLLASYPSTMMQNQLMIPASVASQQLVVLQHNGQCFVLPTVNNQIYNTNQHYTTVRTVPRHHYIRQAVMTSNTTLGQFARSLAPKTSSSAAGMGSFLPNVNSASNATVNPAAFAQHQSPESVRSISQPSPGIYLQMSNGAYTYLQQVTPQQHVSPAIKHPTSNFISPGTARFANPGNSVHYTIPANFVAAQQKQTFRNSSPYNSHSSHRRVDDVNTSDMPVLTSAVPAPTVGPNKSDKSNSGLGSDNQTSFPRNTFHDSGNVISAVPSNLLPVSVPLMLMPRPNCVPTANIPTVNHGKVIHQQQLAPSTSASTHLVPLYRKQPRAFQQVVMAQPQSQADSFTESTKAQDKNSMKRPIEEITESGFEIEPPPILEEGDSCRDSVNLRILFEREAERFYEKVNSGEIITSIVDGCIIEESDHPFPIDWELSEFTIHDEILDETLTHFCTIRNEKTIAQSMPHCKKTETIRTKPLGRGRPRFLKKKGNKVGRKSESKHTVANKGKSKKRKPKSTELDLLLQMDFGPNQGRLCDIFNSTVSVESVVLDGKAEDSEGGMVDKSLLKDIEDKDKMNLNSHSVLNKQTKDIRRTQNQDSTGRNEFNDQKQSLVADDSQVIANSGVKDNYKVEEIASRAHSRNGVDFLNVAGITNFSDEELDAERCNYCNGLLRLKRNIQHPQYCSRKCRKLWKRIPVEGQNDTDNVAYTKTSFSTSTPNASGSSKETTMKSSLSKSCSTNASSLTNNDASPGPTPVLTLKMLSPQEAAIVKNAIPQCSGRFNDTSFERSMDTSDRSFSSQDAQTWTCADVSKWVFGITGSSECAQRFVDEDIDGTSLLILANSDQNLGSLLGLKVGPSLKINNALKNMINK